MRYKDGKCLHYYFYFIDAEFGLCYLRVPTWAPFRLQFYCNGHNWLAARDFGRVTSSEVHTVGGGEPPGAYLPRRFAWY